MRHHIAEIALILACAVIGASSFAQDKPTGSPVAATHGRVTIPGSAFSVEGSGRETRVDDVHDGRRFRGQAFAKVILRTTIQLPTTDPKMEGLAVHFRTSEAGPSLRSVEFRNGSHIEFRVPTLVRGDYTIKESFRPEAQANAWLFKDVPFKVSSQAVLRLEVQYPGGFDSQIDPGEFVLTGVAIDFPVKH
jgi:hypothetical protein